MTPVGGGGEGSFSSTIDFAAACLFMSWARGRQSSLLSSLLSLGGEMEFELWLGEVCWFGSIYLSSILMTEIAALLAIVGAVTAIEDCTKDEFGLPLSIELVIMAIDVREFTKGSKLFVREMSGISKF